MATVSDLEMAVNSTYASILNEIQLSNLNFSIQITPFAAYITLKKSAQKDLNGHHVPPSPPLLVLLQNLQQENLNLRDKNFTLNSAYKSLEKNYNRIVMENASLVDAIEETNNTIAALTKDNEDLYRKIDVADQEAVKCRSERTGIESKIKDVKKRNADQVRDLDNKVANLIKSSKAKDKLIYDLNKKLENSRDKLASCKSEKSLLKTSKTKLEATVRKLEEKKRKSDISDTNGNHVKLKDSFSGKSEAIPSFISNLSGPVFASMVAHWNPLPVEISLMPNSIITMVTHTTENTPPIDFSLWSSTDYIAVWSSVEELKEMMDKMCETVNTMTRKLDKNSID